MPLDRALFALALMAAAPALAPAQVAVESPEPPAVRFLVGGEELVPLVLPGRYGSDPGRVAADAEWTEDRAGDLMEWWRDDGPLLLRRITDYAGFGWPQREVEVHLVRYWPVISIERPLVLAVGAIRTMDREVEIPDDRDFQVLVLAHQITHRLLDPPDEPGRAGGRARFAARDHPFLLPGNFESEAMVNWVVYRALTDLWGAERLAAATDRDLWGAYNPNHAYVTEGLMPRWSLTRTRPLRSWLDAHPRGSEPFRVRDGYRQETEARVPPEGAAVERQRITGTEYGVDLGQSYDGQVFVAFVDEGSPGHRAGVQQGDPLATVDGRPVAGVADAQARMTAAWEDRGEVHLSVRREGREVFLTIESF